jgi:hypothetical protein
MKITIDNEKGTVFEKTITVAAHDDKPEWYFPKALDGRHLLMWCDNAYQDGRLVKGRWVTPDSGIEIHPVDLRKL